MKRLNYQEAERVTVGVGWRRRDAVVGEIERLQQNDSVTVSEQLV